MLIFSFYEDTSEYNFKIMPSDAYILLHEEY